MLIRANKSAAILENALAAVNAEKYDVKEFTEKVFNRNIVRITLFDDELGDTLNELDMQYYALDEDLEYLLADYFKQGNF